MKYFIFVNSTDPRPAAIFYFLFCLTCPSDYYLNSESVSGGARGFRALHDTVLSASEAQYDSRRNERLPSSRMVASRIPVQISIGRAKSLDQCKTYYLTNSENKSMF